MKYSKLAKRVLVITSALLFISCGGGGGGGGDSAPTSQPINGLATLGPLSGATVELSELSNSGSEPILKYSTTTTALHG